MRIYVACLASYNNGVLHGRWIDAASDVEAMQEEISAMLRASRFPNVVVKCTACEGTGKKTFHNSETGFTCQAACPSCRGEGEVPSAEEWAIIVVDGLPSSFGEHPSLEKIAEWVELVENHDEWDADDMAALLKDFGSVEAVQTALEDNFIGTYATFRAYAEEAADEAIAAHCEKGKVPDFLVNYFDYDSYARDLRMDMHVVDVSEGVAVFHA